MATRPTDEAVSVKEYLESQISATANVLNTKIDKIEDHLNILSEERDRARTLALKELERRFVELDHAQQRAADVLQTYMTRETWEKFREEDAIWKRQEEVQRPTWVTQAEFRTYKETTQTALTLSTGKQQGIGSVWGAAVVVLSTLAAVGSMITGIVIIFLRH